MICFILTAPPHSFLSEKPGAASARGLSRSKEPDCSVINADPEDAPVADVSRKTQFS